MEEFIQCLAYELMNTPQEIADMVAYLQSIAPKEMTNKEVFP
jgi:ubiquinol-cytochrome c reductase cytochrome c1 subunit